MNEKQKTENYFFLHLLHYIPLIQHSNVLLVAQAVIGYAIDV